MGRIYVPEVLRGPHFLAGFQLRTNLRLDLALRFLNMVTSPHKTAVCLVFEASRRILLTLKDSPDCAWPTKDNLSLVNLQSTGLGTVFVFFVFFCCAGHRRCTCALSSCSERGYSLGAVLRLLTAVAFLVVACRLETVQLSLVVVQGLSCPQLVEPSETRIQTCVPYIGWQILYH